MILSTVALYAGFLLIILVLVKPIGGYLARVFAGERTFLDPALRPVERFIYALCGIDAEQEMNSKQYALAFVLFSLAGTLLLYAILREALSLVEKRVISPQELDKCFKWALGLKLAVIGPMELLDVAGLDIYEAVASYLNADLDRSPGVSSYISEKTREKNLGMKTGRGIYDYTPQEAEKLRVARAAKLVAVRKALEGS